MKVLVFYSDNSEACRQLQNRLEFMFDTHPQTNAFVEYVGIEDYPEDAEFYGIQKTPTVVIIDKAGAATERMVGYNPNLQYEQFIVNAVRHHNDIDAHPQWKNGNIDRAEIDE